MLIMVMILFTGLSRKEEEKVLLVIFGLTPAKYVDVPVVRSI